MVFVNRIRVMDIVEIFVLQIVVDPPGIEDFRMVDVPVQKVLVDKIKHGIELEEERKEGKIEVRKEVDRTTNLALQKVQEKDIVQTIYPKLGINENMEETNLV